MLCASSSYIFDGTSFLSFGGFSSWKSCTGLTDPFLATSHPNNQEVIITFVISACTPHYFASPISVHVDHPPRRGAWSRACLLPVGSHILPALALFLLRFQSWGL
jgi:hypothetical protein